MNQKRKPIENNRTDIDWDKPGEHRFIVCGLIVAMVFFLFTECLLRSAAASVRTSTYYVSTDGGTLNARFAPVDGEVIACYPNGEPVEVIEIVDGWAAINHGGDTLYMCALYLTKEVKPVGAYTVRSSGRVRVRETPGGRLVRYVRNGDRLNVERWACDNAGCMWAFVGDGYVSSDYLEVSKDD